MVDSGIQSALIHEQQSLFLNLQFETRELREGRGRTSINTITTDPICTLAERMTRNTLTILNDHSLKSHKYQALI